MRLLRLIVGLVCLSPALSRAQSILYWDPDGITSGIGALGGDWNLTTTNWTVDVGGTTLPILWLNNGTVRPAFKSPVGEYAINVASSGLEARGFEFNHSGEFDTGQQWTFAGAGSITLTDEIVDAQAGRADFNVAIASSVGLTKQGAFEVALNAANPGLNGVVNVNDGTLYINHADALGAATAGNGIVFRGGTLIFDSATEEDSFTRSYADPITFEENGAIEVDFDDYQTRTVTLTGPVTLNSDGTFKGGYDSSFGSAKLAVSGVISGTGQPMVEGDVEFSGANTFTARVQVGDYDEDGRLSIPVFNNDGVAGPLGAGTGLLLGLTSEGSSLGEVNYTGGTATSSRTMQIAGEGAIGVEHANTVLTLTGLISRDAELGTTYTDLTKTGPGTLVLKAANTYTGDTYVTGGTLIAGHSNALAGNAESRVVLGGYGTRYDTDVTLLLENGVTLDRYTKVYNYNNDGGSTTLGLSGTGSAAFDEEVYIQRSIDVSVGSGGTLHFNEFVNDGEGGGSVNKLGAGLTVFSGGIDLRGGGINIHAGEVRINSTADLANGIEVASGGKLTGDGSITGPIDILTGAGFSPGDGGAGTLTVGDIVMDAGSSLHWELGALTTTATTGDEFDRVLVASLAEDAFFIDHGVELTVDLSLLSVSLRPSAGEASSNDPFWQSVRIWQIFDFSGSGANELSPGDLDLFTVTNANQWAGGTFDTFVGGGVGEFASFASGDVFLRFTPVPEPSTWVLLGLGALAVLLPRLRRRSMR